MNIFRCPNLSAQFSVRKSFKVAAAGTGLLVCLLVQGCSSPDAEPAAKAAVLGRLSPSDRQTVLGGDIRKGLNKDAVRVAWGSPSKTTVNQTAKGPQECWTYVQTFNGYGGGYYGIARGLVHGSHGDHYSTNDFYPAPTDAQTLGGTPTTEVPVKRVIFEGGRVVSYETTHSHDGSENADDEN